MIVLRPGPDLRDLESLLPPVAARDVSQQLRRSHGATLQSNPNFVRVNHESSADSSCVSGCGTQFGKSEIAQPSGYPPDILLDG